MHIVHWCQTLAEIISFSLIGWLLHHLHHYIITLEGVYQSVGKSGFLEGTDWVQKTGSCICFIMAVNIWRILFWKLFLYRTEYSRIFYLEFYVVLVCVFLCSQHCLGHVVFGKAWIGVRLVQVQSFYSRLLGQKSCSRIFENEQWWCSLQSWTWKIKSVYVCVCARVFLSHLISILAKGVCV